MLEKWKCVRARVAYMAAPWIFAVAVAAIPGAASAQNANPMVFNRLPASSTIAYWTPERMAAAVPLDMGMAAGPTMPTVAPTTTGTPRVAGGSLPGQHASLGPLPDSTLAGANTNAPMPADGAYPGPHTTFEYLPKYRTFPISTIGKLFFTINGSGFVCSASVTRGGTPANLIWTAGHCVANGGHSTFYTNWLFCPSYNQSGVNPAVGCWSWSFATTNNTWFASGALTRDYAMIGLQSSGTVVNNDVANVTGSLGFAWNWGRDQNWIHMGYPAASPFNGTRIIVTNTEHRYDDAIDLLGPATNSWGSSQTPGSSGSPVMLFWSYSGAFINSDVSYFYTNQAGFELQGPYFDSTTCSFWKSVTGYTGTC